MKVSWIPALVALATLIPCAQAAPVRTDQVPQDARWIAHLDVHRLLQGQFGQFLLAEMSKEDAQNKLAAFQAVFNFDPRRDIDSLTLFGASDNPDDGTVLVRGRFDTAQLLTLLRAGDGYAASSHQGLEVHQWIDAKNKSSGEKSYGSIFTDGTIILSNRRASVEKALDVLSGRLPNLAQGGGMDPGAMPASAFFMAVADYAAIGAMNPKAAMFRQAQSGSVSMAEEGGMMLTSLVLGAKDATTAAQLQMVAQGVVALALIGADENPAMAKVAQGAQIRLQGSQLLVDIRYPVQEMIQLMKDAAAKGQRATTP